jgi:hypothetical protein
MYNQNSISGNHDWHYGKQGALSQIEYYKKNNKWQLESFYYSKIIGSAHFIFIDTTMLCPELSYYLTGQKFSQEDCDTQYEWILKTLSNSDCDWIVVFGHYPVYSSGENGSTKALLKLELIMQEYNVDAYICGHDHSLQHLYNPTTKLDFFVSGAGCGRYGYFRGHHYTVKEAQTAGFLNCTINNEVMRVEFISAYKGCVHSVNIKRKDKKKLGIENNDSFKSIKGNFNSTAENEV